MPSPAPGGGDSKRFVIVRRSVWGDVGGSVLNLADSGKLWTPQAPGSVVKLTRPLCPKRKR